GDDQVVTVGDHRVQHPTVRGVGHGNGDVDLALVDRAGDLGVPVGVQVGVVGAAEADPQAVDLQRGPDVGEVLPAGLFERPAQVLPGQRLLVRFGGALRLGQVAQRVLEAGAVVVVGAPDVDAGQVQQRVQRVQDGLDGVDVGEVVPGVDHQVGFQGGEPPDPVLLLPLAGGEVQVGDVQHPDRYGVRRQHRHLDPAQPEGAHLVAGGVDQAAGADGTDSEHRSGRDLDHPTHRHAARVQAASPSTRLGRVREDGGHG